jgi:glutaredoxin
MTLTLYISDDCPSCAKVQNKLKHFIKYKNNINLRIADIKKEEPVQPIVPALFVDNLLYAYGDFETQKLENLIDQKLKR